MRAWPIAAIRERPLRPKAVVGALWLLNYGSWSAVSTSLALARREPREPALRILREDRAEKKPLEPPHGLDTAVSLAKQCGSLLRGHEKARQLSRFRRSRKIALANRILQAVFDGCLHFVEHFHHSSADSLVVIRKLRSEVAQDATLPGPPILQDVD